MHEEELLAVGLSMNCLYPAVVLSVSISQFLEFMILFFYHFEHQALKSPVTIEHKRSCWVMFLRRKSKLMQNLFNLSLSWLGE